MDTSKYKKRTPITTDAMELSAFLINLCKGKEAEGLTQDVLKLLIRTAHELGGYSWTFDSALMSNTPKAGSGPMLPPKPMPQEVYDMLLESHRCAAQCLYCVETLHEVGFFNDEEYKEVWDKVVTMIDTTGSTYNMMRLMMSH